MSISSYQKKIILSATDIAQIPAKMDRIGFKIVADFTLEGGKALRVAFEDDAVVYIYTGIIDSRSGSFWSSGAELTLCNVEDSVVLATFQALLASL